MEQNIKKINFHNQQLLRAEDFQDEQQYHIAMRRLRNSAYHTFGLVRGLDIGIDGSNSSRLTVEHGAAIVPYKQLGAEVYITEDTNVDIKGLYSDWQKKNNNQGASSGEVQLLLALSYSEDFEVNEDFELNENNSGGDDLTANNNLVIDPIKGPYPLYYIESGQFFVYPENTVETSEHIKLCLVRYDVTAKKVIDFENAVQYRDLSNLNVKQLQFEILHLMDNTQDGTEYDTFPNISADINIAGDLEKRLNVVSNDFIISPAGDQSSHLFIEKGDLTARKDVKIKGNLLVEGKTISQNTSSFISSELFIKDNILTLNNDTTDDVNGNKPINAGFEFNYKGGSTDIRHQFLWECNNITDVNSKKSGEVSWQLVENANGVVNKRKIAYGIEEMRIKDNADAFHKHSVLYNPGYNFGQAQGDTIDNPVVRSHLHTLDASDDSNKTSIGLGLAANNTGNRLLVNGSLKSASVLFGDGTRLVEPIVPVTPMFTHVLFPSGNSTADTLAFSEAVKTGNAILITGDWNRNTNGYYTFVLNSTIDIQDVNDLVITAADHIRIVNKSAGTPLFQIKGNCNNITIKNINIRSSGTSLVGLSPDSKIRNLFVDHCSNVSLVRYTVDPRYVYRSLFNASRCTLNTVQIRNCSWRVNPESAFVLFDSCTISGMTIVDNDIAANRTAERAVVLTGVQSGYQFTDLVIDKNCFTGFKKPVVVTGFVNSHMLQIRGNRLLMTDGLAKGIYVCPVNNETSYLHMAMIMYNYINAKATTGIAVAIELEGVRSGILNHNEIVLKVPDAAAPEDSDQCFSVTESSNCNVSHNIIVNGGLGTLPDEESNNINTYGNIEVTQ